MKQQLISLVLIGLLTIFHSENVNAEETIQNIFVSIGTVEEKGAGTDDPVYLSVGGREFLLDVHGVNNYQSGQVDEFNLGDRPNVAKSEINDPRRSSMTCGAALDAPAYLRKSRDGENGPWLVSVIRVNVRCGDGDVVKCRPYLAKETYQGAWSISGGVWLSNSSGLVLQLKCGR